MILFYCDVIYCLMVVEFFVVGYVLKGLIEFVFVDVWVLFMYFFEVCVVFVVGLFSVVYVCEIVRVSVFVDEVICNWKVDFVVMVLFEVVVFVVVECDIVVCICVYVC